MQYLQSNKILIQLIIQKSSKKKISSFSLLKNSTLALSQTKTATTEDGKKVLLKEDITCQYITSTIKESD